MKVLEKIVLSTGGESFNVRLVVIVSRISAIVICGVYLYLYFVLAPAGGFIYNPKLFLNNLLSLSDLFNSFIMISVFTLLSITAIIPGLIAIFYGLLDLGKRKGRRNVVWGLIGFFVGTMNFYILLTNCTPS